MRRLVGGIIRANNAFNFIKDGDKIGVGVSGGKDSSLLLIALNHYANFMKNKKGWNIQIYGVHIVMNYYENINYKPYKNWLKKMGLKVKFINSNVGEILRAKLSKQGKVQCSLCAKLKKAIMVREAKKLGINKLATGHHMDDAIETFFMNFINEGRIATFMPDNFFDRNNIHLIRPFILIKESETQALSKQMKIPVIKDSCPNEHSTQRDYIKHFIKNNFYENPKLKASYKNFQIALLNGKQSQLWFDGTSHKKDLLTKSYRH
ncbi:MAG: tRNA 2-thiocytidine biosynthesis TtcA family protein [Mycoplasmataceae bacterium]|nr:tRNA 2-thiocytidine biosynthesis TtcA family protein [Mycoplasmataceae bacterium]